MISEKAIKGFLERELQNFDWVKKLSPSQINSVLAELVPQHLTKSLWLHQRAALLLMQHYPRFIFFMGMGGGKTNLMLTMLRQRKLNGEKPRSIVFVPYLTAVDTWISEVEKWAPELKCVPLLGSSQENAATLQNGIHQSDEILGDIFVICYASAICIADSGLFLSFDTLILDEIHNIKNHRTKRFQLVKSISEQATHVYGLTGTPFGKDLQDLWAEFYVIDFGETLGPNISFYRNVFFTRKSGFFGGVEFKFKKKLTRDLQRIIKNRSIHYSVKEFADMPEKQYIQRRIQLPLSIKSYVDRELEKLEEGARNKDREVAGNAFMQLRQLSSGFITFKDDENRVKVKFDSNPKLDVLCELIESMPPECKMVVFHDYVFTNQLISERLTELKIGHARIWGGQRDQIGQLKKFREDESCRVLVINSKSGSSALNLQFANYLCFFECPSVIDREQAEARCWRPGQKNKVIIYDLFINGTVDEDHYTSVKAGGDFLKDFMSGSKRSRR